MKYTLKEARECKKYTQKRLSDESGIPLKTIQSYEQNCKDLGNMPIDMFCKLNKVLNIDPEDLFEPVYKNDLDTRMQEVQKNLQPNPERRITKYLTYFLDLEDTEAYGEKLIQARITAGYQSKDIAHILGIFPSAYNRYEKGHRKVPLLIGVKVAYIVGKSFRELFGKA